VFGVVGRIIRFVLLSLLSPLSVVAVDVTVLAHSVCVELRVGTVPRLLRAAVFVVAVAAHSLRIVLPFGVAAAVRLLSVYNCEYIFFLAFRVSCAASGSSARGSLSICSRFSSLRESS